MKALVCVPGKEHQAHVSRSNITSGRCPGAAFGSVSITNAHDLSSLASGERIAPLWMRRNCRKALDQAAALSAANGGKVQGLRGRSFPKTSGPDRTKCLPLRSRSDSQKGFPKKCRSPIRRPRERGTFGVVATVCPRSWAGLSAMGTPPLHLLSDELFSEISYENRSRGLAIMVAHPKFDPRKGILREKPGKLLAAKIVSSYFR